MLAIKNFLKQKLFLISTIALFCFAFFVRFYELTKNSLWTDELWLVRAIEQPFSQIFQFIYSNQKPIPYLYVVFNKVLITLFGNSDLVYRLVPAIFSCISVVLIFLLTQKITKNNWITLISTSLFAFNIQVLEYAREAKQYSGEICWTLLLFYITEQYCTNIKYKKWLFVLLLVISILGIFLFFPTVIISVVCFTRILLTERKTPSKHTLSFLYIGICLVAFAIQYFFLIPKVSSTLSTFWSLYFPSEMTLIGLISFAVSHTADFFIFLYSPQSYPYITTGLLFLLCMYGMFVAFKKYRLIFLYAGLPFILTLFISLLHKYPFGGTRVDLFLAPLLFIAIAVGSFNVITYIQNKKIQIILLTIFVVLSPFFVFYNHFNYKNIFYQNSTENIRELLSWYAQHKQPTDITYLYWDTKNGFYHYIPNNVQSTSTTLIGKRHSSFEEYKPEIQLVLTKAENKRLWILLAHFDGHERQVIMDEMFKYCKPLDSYKGNRVYGALVGC